MLLYEGKKGMRPITAMILLPLGLKMPILLVTGRTSGGTTSPLTT